MALSGYPEDPNVPCFFAHKSNGLTFTQVVDGLLVKYHARTGLEHLLSCLEVLYVLQINRTGKKYIDIALEWNSDDPSVTLSMPKYVERILQHFPCRGPEPKAKSPAVYINWHPRTCPQLTKTAVSCLHLLPPSSRRLRRLSIFSYGANTSSTARFFQLSMPSGRLSDSLLRTIVVLRHCLPQ